MRRIFREQGFTAESMAHPKIRALVQATADIYMGAVSPALESGVVPEVMAQHLRDDIFVFSGFKTYQELREVADLLRDKNGLMKPFHRFYNDVAAINEKYNRHWLKAEYIFAQASSEMAAKWADFEKDGDSYDLQYRTAADDRVRYEHRVLHRVTLPPSDPFWEEFFPPNGWRCRCTAVQVRKGKYPRSDSNTAIQQGREATYQAGKNGVNKAAIFRYNPGKQQVIFPPHHPYYEVSERQRKAVLEALAKEARPIKEQELPGILTDEEVEAINSNNQLLAEALAMQKGDPMTYEEANKGRENPNYSKKRSYQVNCQTCVPVHLLRRRGFNVEAAPNVNRSAYELMAKQGVEWDKNLFINADGSDTEFSWLKEWAYKNGLSRPSKKHIVQFLNENMKEDGLYEVYCGWKKGNAHVFCAEVKDGKIRLFDPQPGRDDVAYYIDSMKAMSVGVLRIDNKLINPKVAGLFIKSQ